MTHGQLLASFCCLLLVTSSSISRAQELACGTSPVEIPNSYLPVNAVENDFPWLVRLNIRCTGSILGRQWVLTAAHCVFAKSGSVMAAKDIEVYVNDLSLVNDDPREQVIGVDRVVPHPLFNEFSLDYDFALLHLTESLTWSSTVKPICLLQDCTAEIQASNNVTCVMAGWGSDRAAYGAGQIDNRLKKQAIMPVDRSLCQSSISAQSYLENFLLTSQMTCAGYQQGGIDDCQSDSGGPLICRSTNNLSFYLHGISSFGFGCGLQTGYYRLFARPCAITSWILTSTRPRF